MTSLPSPAPPQETAVTCLACGHNLTGATIGGGCPECGSPIAPSFQGSMAPTSSYAVASMILGISSIPMSLSGCACVMVAGLPGIVGFGLGIAAILTARAARREVAVGTRGGPSAGMATAGLICGIIGTVFGSAQRRLACRRRRRGRHGHRPERLHLLPLRAPQLRISIPAG